MGELIVAEHLELGRSFVVKLLHERLAGDPQLVDRVRVEAQSLGRLNHPNVVSVVGFGHADLQFLCEGVRSRARYNQTDQAH